jgi:hypothetical protein
MALDKNIVPGTQIRVKSLKGKTAGIWVGGSIMNGVTLWDRNALGQAIVATARLGDTLTVIKKPRKVYGINVCQVETANGIQGEVYWTELRSNCEV